MSKEKRLTQSGGKSRWLPLCCKKATVFIFYNCTKDSLEMGERGLVTLCHLQPRRYSLRTGRKGSSKPSWQPGPVCGRRCLCERTNVYVRLPTGYL